MLSPGKVGGKVTSPKPSRPFLYVHLKVFAPMAPAIPGLRLEPFFFPFFPPMGSRILLPRNQLRTMLGCFPPLRGFLQKKSISPLPRTFRHPPPSRMRAPMPRAPSKTCRFPQIIAVLLFRTRRFPRPSGRSMSPPQKLFSFPPSLERVPPLASLTRQPPCLSSPPRAILSTSAG